jgi:geranylgeranyl pyrophosphate synthase
VILANQVDAILGVACLDVLERSLDRILLAGIPCMAVPLFASRCRESRTDLSWVHEMIDTPYGPASVRTRSYVHLLRCAAGLFEPEQMRQLMPPLRGGPTPTETGGEGLAGLDPVTATEAIAHEFLLRGGKHARPFVTLAAYDAMASSRTGIDCTGPSGAEHVDRLPQPVKRVALAIETFHKASLVHDDVEDDDAFRYGRPALHRQYGLPTAVNVGDYLIGLGYRIVADQQTSVGADVVGDLIARLAEAHLRLCEGQGAELAWRDGRRAELSPMEAIKIYALKTAPAFEVALYAGLRLAGPAESYRQPIARFARQLGVAFQINNDLDDWRGERSNKGTIGSDALGGRPTVLLALTLEGLRSDDRRRLRDLVQSGRTNDKTRDQIRELYERAGAFAEAGRLVQKHRQRAREIADRVRPDRLRDLLHYLADSLLRR